MLKLEKKFLNHLESENYQSILDNHWFVAISAGVDSLALLYLLHFYCRSQKKNNLTAIHFNHKLNPQSHLWQNHCQLVCNALNIPLIVDAADKHIKSNSSVFKSFENQARNLRYQSFKKNLTANCCLFLAHHKDDQIETFLFRLARGASSDGLAAIREHQTLRNIQSQPIFLKRPLLELCGKKELYQYAKAKGVDWLEDNSNQDSRIKRNFIRQEVVPQIKQIHPKAKKNLLRQVKKQQQISDLIKEIANQDIANCLKQKDLAAYLSIKKLKKLSKIRLQNLIYQFANQNWGFYFEDTKQLNQLIKTMVYQSKPMDQFQIKDIRLINFNFFILAFRGNQLIEKPLLTENDAPKKILSNQLNMKPSHGFLSVKPVKKGEFGIDINQLSELEIIAASNVKKIKLAKRAHHQRVNKLFQEYNIPLFLRSFYPMIGLNHQVIALPNIALSDSYQAKQQLDKSRVEAVKISWHYW